MKKMCRLLYASETFSFSPSRPARPARASFGIGQKMARVSCRRFTPRHCSRLSLYPAADERGAATGFFIIIINTHVYVTFFYNNTRRQHETTRTRQHRSGCCGWRWHCCVRFFIFPFPNAFLKLSYELIFP